MERRKRFLRRYGGYGYPSRVCEPCGREAARSSKTEIMEPVSLELKRKTMCIVCKSQNVPLATCRDFGNPTFYTFESGQPCGGRS